MSVQAMSWVLEKSKATLGSRLVLLSIANHADQRGNNAWPSVATIAREAHLSPRQVQRCIRSLVGIGELHVEESVGPRGTHRYRLPVPAFKGDNLSPSFCQGDICDTEGVTSATPGGDMGVTRTVLEPPSNRPRESAPRKRSAEPNGARLPIDWALPDDWRQWALENTPGVDPDSEALIFADYWHSTAGARGRKANWQATWRNWCRRAVSMGRRKNGQPSQRPKNRAEATADAYLESLGLAGGDSAGVPYRAD